MANFLPWADRNGAFVVGGTGMPWGGADDDLLKDPASTPTDGYGKTFHDREVNHPEGYSRAEFSRQ